MCKRYKTQKQALWARRRVAQGKSTQHIVTTMISTLKDWIFLLLSLAYKSNHFNKSTLVHALREEQLSVSLVYGRQWLRFKRKFREQSATAPDLLVDWTLPSTRNDHVVILGVEVETANEGKSAIHIALLWPILLNNGEYVHYGSGTFRESCVCRNFTLVTI